MGILEKAENLGKKVGKDVEALWDEFEAYVEGKSETAKVTAEAPEKAAGATEATEAPNPPEAPAEAPGEAETGGDAA